MLHTIRSLLRRDPVRETTDDQNTGDDSETVSPAEWERASALVEQATRRAEATFNDRWENRDREGSIKALNEWYGWRTIGTLLETERPADTRTYQVDSLVLSDCYRQLVADPDNESIVYLTGLVLNATTYTLNRCVAIDHAEQSASGVASDPDSSFETLLAMEENGHRLLCHGHNHPGKGVNGTMPSQPDWDTQERLDNGGYDAIGLIMSRDGYVRFFAHDNTFTTEVYGNHVERINDHIYRLQEPVRTANDRFGNT